MPPHLHPRSRSTTSLFTATLLASLVIVGIPHAFPCPAPRHASADANTRRRNRIRKEQEPTSSEIPIPNSRQLGVPSELEEQAAEFRHMEAEAKRIEKASRECPVPKPQGVLGQLLGFNSDR